MALVDDLIMELQRLRACEKALTECRADLVRVRVRADVLEKMGADAYHQWSTCNDTAGAMQRLRAVLPDSAFAR